MIVYPEQVTVLTFDSTSLPSNTNAPIWSMSIEIHGKFLLGRLFLSSLKYYE